LTERIYHEKAHKKQLRNGYGYFSIDIEINKLMQKIIFDEPDATKCTAHHYSNGVETLTEEELLWRYRDFLGDEMEIVAGIPPPDFIEIAIENMESRDPVAFLGGFNRWADEQGWLPCAGNITESGAGIRAADEVNS